MDWCNTSTRIQHATHEIMQEIELRLPKSPHVLTLSNSECTLIQKRGLCRQNQVNLRSYWIRLGSKSSDWCTCKRMRGHTETCTQKRRSEVRDRDWSDIAINQGMPRIVRSHQKLGRGKRFLSQGLQRELWYYQYLHLELLASIINERIHFCCFKLPSLLCCATAAQETNTGGFSVIIPNYMNGSLVNKLTKRNYRTFLFFIIRRTKIHLE